MNTLLRPSRSARAWATLDRLDRLRSNVDRQLAMRPLAMRRRGARPAIPRPRSHRVRRPARRAARRATRAGPDADDGPPRPAPEEVPA